MEKRLDFNKVSNAIYQLLYNGLIDQDDVDILLAKLKDKSGDLKTGIYLGINLYYRHPVSDFPTLKKPYLSYPPHSHPDYDLN